MEFLAGEPAAFAPRAIPAVVFTDPEIAWAGLTEVEAKRQGRKMAVAMFPWGARAAHNRSAGPRDSPNGLSIPTANGSSAAGLSRGAGDLISEAVVAIEMGASVRDLTESIHPHPTLSETLGTRPKRFMARPPISISRSGKRSRQSAVGSRQDVHTSSGGMPSHRQATGGRHVGVRAKHAHPTLCVARACPPPPSPYPFIRLPIVNAISNACS